MLVAQRAAGAAAAALIALATGGVGLVDGVFGLYDSTAEELADLFGVDEAPPAAVAAVRVLRPVYEPLKSLSPSCTAALYPEFNDDLDWNDCSLLPRRVFWRSGVRAPLVVQQTMRTDNMWDASTGSAVWGGGVVLKTYMEGLGEEFWAGKRVVELGTGTGLGAITAAKLGAVEVLATDRDVAVLRLAEANARANGVRVGDGASRPFRTALLEWGPRPGEGDGSSSTAPAGGALSVDAQQWDMVVGADLTYNRDAWPLLVQTIKRLNAPVILTASERRVDELANLQAFFAQSGLRYEVAPSPMERGYGREKVRVYRIAVEQQQ